MKRICIYLVYDKDNIIDSYIGYILKELKTCTNFLSVVYNGLDIKQGEDILKKYADEIYYRKNIGLDAGGFKDMICKYLGWERILLYDELVLVNDSFFGPFCSMIKIFQDMENRKVDFWGLSKYNTKLVENNCLYPEHIQSFFLVIRKKMLHSKLFRNYWEEMPYYKTYKEVVQKNEVKFTEYFSERGYLYESFSDMAPNDSKNINNNYNQYLFIPFELIKKRNFPILKRKAVINDSLNYPTQENVKLALEYIKNNTNYDINLIWDNILRIFNLSDLQRSLHLQYIISKEKQILDTQMDIMIGVFIRYKGSEEYVIEYIDRLKDKYKIKIYSLNSEVLNLYNRKGYKCECIKESEIYKKILLDCEKSKFICIIHDSDITGDIEPSYVGKSYFYNIWENLLKDEIHITNIVKQFEEDSRLGVLTPPEVNFGDMTLVWRNNFENVNKLAQEIGLKCPIAYNKRPFTVSENFWVKREILESVCRRSDCDFLLLPYILSYFAQEKGYYAAYVETSDYAAMNQINLQYYLSLISDQIRDQYGEFNNFLELSTYITRGAILNFCKDLEYIYIYGTGIVAQRYQETFPYINGYIVSDGQPKEDTIRGIKVRYLSEIKPDSKSGIVICMSRENQQQVVPLLNKLGWNKFLCV